MKPVYWPALLNLVGVSVALIYGVGGGSGGETTEGVFLTFWWTGWLTILVASTILIRSVVRKELLAGDTLILGASATFGFFETLLWHPLR